MTTKISDLPRDLLQEIFSKVPKKYLRVVRSICKTWNKLSKESFTNKCLAPIVTASEREFLVVMVKDFRLCLLSVNLHGIQNNKKSSIKHRGQLINRHDSYPVGISGVCHCAGLLLLFTRDDKTSLKVWNPYTEKTRRIELRGGDDGGCNKPCYAIGYETRKSCRNYKILRYRTWKYGFYEIYELDSNSWRVLKVTSIIWETWFHHDGISVNGNSYWYIYRKETLRKRSDYLICFDFTTERFGPLMSLPFQANDEYIVTLSTVREEQLAVLCQRRDVSRMEIWITNKIEPNEVSWSKLFLKVIWIHLLIVNLTLKMGISSLTWRRKSLWFLIELKAKRCKTPTELASWERMASSE